MVVPLLLFGYHFSPQEAVGTSLAVVFLNALSGSVAYMVQRRVLYTMGLAFAVATIPGALVGARLVQYLNSRWFSMLLGVFLLLIAAFLHRGQQLPFVRRTIALTLRDVSRFDDLLSADEVFLCGTAIEILPVAEVDGRRIGRVVPGPVTEQMRNAYDRAKTGRAPQWQHWLHRVALQEATASTAASKSTPLPMSVSVIHD